MNQVRKLAHDPYNERTLHILSVPSVGDIPSFDLDSQYFGVFLASDSTDTTAEDLLSVGKHLIDLGAVHFCCWGPGCEDAHDAIDHADRDNERPNDEVLMTTWHEGEPLKEALWFFLNTAFPHDAYEDGCRASIAIIVDNKSWAEECDEALSSPREFSERALS